MLLCSSERVTKKSFPLLIKKYSAFLNEWKQMETYQISLAMESVHCRQCLGHRFWGSHLFWQKWLRLAMISASMYVWMKLCLKYKILSIKKFNPGLGRISALLLGLLWYIVLFRTHSERTDSRQPHAKWYVKDSRWSISTFECKIMFMHGLKWLFKSDTTSEPWSAGFLA